MQKTITITIDNFLLPTFNSFYSYKIHYHRRHKLVFKWKLVMSDKIRRQLTIQQINDIKNGKFMRVDVTISQAKRRYDVDNCVMYGKIFLDCLKVICGIDDTPKIINSISYKIDLEQKVNKVIYEVRV